MSKNDSVHRYWAATVRLAMCSSLTIAASPLAYGVANKAAMTNHMFCDLQSEEPSQPAVIMLSQLYSPVQGFAVRLRAH